MHHSYLGLRLGEISPESFRRKHLKKLILRIVHFPHVSFAGVKVGNPPSQGGTPGPSDHSARPPSEIAHTAGVNCLAIDAGTGRYLISGGADASIRLWDLESREKPDRYEPVASLSRANPQSHTHALTSLSIYPHDPTPTTLLSTAYDVTLRLTAISPTGLQPIHSFRLNHAPFTHALSPLPSSSPLIAVGTKSPHIPLIDLRTTSTAHTLAGANGEVYALSWSPVRDHILASGSADGLVLLYDIRRAAPAFANLSLDDAVGVLGEPGLPSSARDRLLDYNLPAHNGPVTSVQWTPAADKLVTAGHDGRIRLWDTASGRNELVHFGPRIRNHRTGHLAPLITPRGTHAPGREVLLWPNDDGRGDILVHGLREGNMLGILRTEGLGRATMQARGIQGTSKVGRLTSGGRINQLVWRYRSDSGDGVEMYSAHGDGRIGAWRNRERRGESGGGGDGDGPDEGDGEVGEGDLDEEEAERERRRKRKRDLIGDLMQGLTKKPVPFS